MADLTSPSVAVVGGGRPAWWRSLPVAVLAPTHAPQPTAPPPLSSAMETPSGARAPSRKRLLTRLGWRRRKDG
ncbi:hypothetical protein I3W98_32485 [Streptomyces cavourensis]|nr:hypothetical protein [Streptomyces cavourensis]